jgi:peroxiredoxin
MRRKAPLLAILLLGLALIGVVIGAAATARTPEPAAPAGIDAALKQLELIRPSRPKVAEDFTLPTIDGGSFRLGEQRGKVVLVNFWATWCAPCLEEMPAMERLWRRHKDAGFILVAVSVDTDPKKVPPFVSARKFSFPVVVDPKMAVAEKYGVRAVPSSFVVDRTGTMAGVALGPRVWDGAAAHGLVEAMLR